MKKLTKRDGASKPNVVNILEKENPEMEKTDAEDGKILEDRSLNVDIKTKQHT